MEKGTLKEVIQYLSDNSPLIYAARCWRRDVVERNGIRYVATGQIDQQKRRLFLCGPDYIAMSGFVRLISRGGQPV